MAAMVAAAMVTVYIWPRPAPLAPAPMMSARLASGPGTGGQAIFVAVFDPSHHRILLTPAQVTAASGRSPELWLIPAGGKPIPIGVGTFETPVTFTAAEDPAASGAVLAVSIEPLGGSPTGQPTGPVVATGSLTAS